MHAIGQSGKHMFWLGNSPRPVPLVSRQLPLVTMRPRLGDAAVQFQLPPDEPDPPSRLDGLSIAAIQNRILINPTVQRYIQKKTEAENAPRTRFGGAPVGSVPGVVSFFERTYGPLPTLTDQEIATLTAIAADPTDEELKDVAIIDGFFPDLTPANSYRVRNEMPFTEGICAGLDPKAYGLRGLGAVGMAPMPAQEQLIANWMTYEPPRGRYGVGPRERNATEEEVDAIKDSKFFCVPPASWAAPQHVQENYAGWWGIDPNQTWGAVKRQVKNAITMMEVIAAYPFPPPIDKFEYQWWHTVQSGIQQSIKGGRVHKEGFRYWITISVLTNYNDMVDRIEADLKRKAKKAKRKSIMKAIGIAIVGIIAPYLLPVLIVAAAVVVKLAIDTYMTLKERREAAKEMAETAKLFANDAPLFADQVTELSDLMDSQAAQAEASIPLPPDIAEEVGQVPGEIHPLVFGTGIAAAVGLTALAIFKK